MNKKTVGDLGEKIAVDSLKKQGFKIIEKNYRCKNGEIDIIAEANKSLVFVEVRTKTNGEFGTPEESITANKKEKIVNSVFSYLNSHSCLSRNWRIDFIGIELTHDGQVKRLNHIENAIQY
jgi:putative endonuclease